MNRITRRWVFAPLAVMSLIASTCSSDNFSGAAQTFVPPTAATDQPSTDQPSTETPDPTTAPPSTAPPTTASPTTTAPPAPTPTVPAPPTVPTPVTPASGSGNPAAATDSCGGGDAVQATPGVSDTPCSGLPATL